MGWVLSYYRGYLNKEKDPLPPMDDVVDFYVSTDAKWLKNNLKDQVCPREFKEKFKKVVTYYCDVYCEEWFIRPIWKF